ncbi:protein translocase subunit SecF [Rhodoluna lacicola]|jgi:preprotein translocase subunit SecF|uniref:Protein-export membrane protein SecF n=1 Tax=Rhodoluna lacicola TaxID=529884 RepID=A0A060JLQ4_9MICO|nr:protein translocase subunit SecF [Rhodoluna lacicola]AIC47523.1 protein-export membrane protein SecF [Rhodoluna lacicola]BDS50420.1 protein-export membrane protein SecF [Rhodoluna lacicola]
MSKFSDFGNDLYTGKRSINFVGRRKTFYGIAIVMIILAVVLPSLRGGFNFGIEFRGGSEFRVSGVSDSSQQIAVEAVQKVEPESQPLVTNVGTNGIRVQTEQLTDIKSEEVRVSLAQAYGVDSSSVASSFIGANWGADVTGKALNGLVVFIALAAVLMALYFRTLKMSLAAVAALVHDLIITAGLYGALGFEVTPAAVIGFLTILGYSLYDTVVVFDKIRENTFEVEFSETTTFAQQVNYAINQTLVRSINTSIVAVLPVASILFIGATLLGAGTLRDIALALFIGIIVGTYSTIFIAAPLYSHLREGEAKYKRASEKILATK